MLCWFVSSITTWSSYSTAQKLTVIQLSPTVLMKREQHPVLVFVSSHRGGTQTQMPTNNTTDPDSKLQYSFLPEIQLDHLLCLLVFYHWSNQTHTHMHTHTHTCVSLTLLKIPFYTNVTSDKLSASAWAYWTIKVVKHKKIKSHIIEWTVIWVYKFELQGSYMILAVYLYSTTCFIHLWYVLGVYIIPNCFVFLSYTHFFFLHSTC